MIKQLLDEIEQSIVICQWRGDQLLAEASPLACARCSENKTLLQLVALKVRTHLECKSPLVTHCSDSYCLQHSCVSQLANNQVTIKC